MIVFVIAFLFGGAVLQFFPVLPTYPVWIILGAMGFIIYKYKQNVWICCLSAVFLGFIWTSDAAKHVMGERLQNNLENIPTKIVGEIISFPTQYDNAIRFKFKDDKTNNIFLLSWYGNKFMDFKKGQRWEWNVKLKRPHGLANPGGFDYERHLFLEKIHATGYVLTNKPYKQLENNNILMPLYDIRNSINLKLDSMLKDHFGLAFIQALTLGERKNLSSNVWEVLQNTGTSHLIAISGLHIGIVVGFFYFLFLFLFKRCLTENRWINPVQISSLCAVFFGFIYAALAGFSLPTVRAVFMISLLMIFKSLKKSINGWNILALAVIVVLLIDPFASFRAGFWFSFIAVLIIYYVTQHYSFRSKISQMQLCISLGLFPVTLLWFENASVISPFVNLIAIPILSFIIVPLALTGVMLLFFSSYFGNIIIIMASYCMEYLYWGLEKVADLPFASIHYAFSGKMDFIFLLIAVLLMILPSAIPCRQLFIFFCLPLIFPFQSSLKTDELKFTLLDVGQGLASVIQTAHHTLVFDTGVKLFDSYDTGSRVLLPFLSSQNINQIDILVISHNDNDHIGGAQTMLSHVPIKKTFASEPLPFKVDSFYRCHEGISWEWDNIEFTFLSPNSDLTTKRNNLSCVLKVTTGKHSILLTGDIEKSVEMRLVERFGQQLASTLLVVPHHGSKTSSTAAFVDSVSPTYALYSAGYLNRFKFPHAQVQKVYDERGIITLNTSETGAISFIINLDNSEIKPNLYRKSHLRFWFD